MNRFGSTRDDWPYQPWPARSEALSHWEDDAPETGSLTSRAPARKWLLLALVPVLVVGLAGVAVARLLADADSETSSEDSFSSVGCPDQHLAALVREHRETVRGL
jgi:hypothetical protein